MQPMRIRTISEDDLDTAIVGVGGCRAHPDADRRQAGEVGADFILGDAIIEIKILDDDGLDAPERQTKLAELFRPYQLDRPVVVIDPLMLGEDDLRRYKLAMQTPIKTGVAKAKKQLHQSRSEFPHTTCSVLMVINNRFTALTHDELVALVSERVPRDTTKIDVAVVAGCYVHGDGFELSALWPIDQIVFNEESPFTAFESLHRAWHSLAEDTMTALMRGEPGSKSEEADKIFDHEGVRYVRPARQLGKASKFYIHGRPRENSSGIDACPPVATSFPTLTPVEWHRLAPLFRGEAPFDSFDAWSRFEGAAELRSEPLKPLVSVPVSRGSFEAWRRRDGSKANITALMAHANAVFDREVKRVIATAQEHRRDDPWPRRFVLVFTDEIGRDRANDVSRMALIESQPDREPTAHDLIGNAQIFHEHALALAAAYAMKFRTEKVRWHREQRYGWA